MYSWNLDSVGNWKSTTAIDYDGVETTQNRTHNKLHQLIEAGGGDYYHDPNGNMIETPSQWLTFDALNRLTAVTPKGNTQDVAFRYDAQGRRIRKTVAGEAATKTDYIYSGIQCIEERDSENSMAKQYVWGHYVDELLQIKTADGKRFYPLQDLLYRTNALTDGNGNIVEEYDTDAYGNTLFTPADENVETPTCEFIFTGRRLDPETGLYYYRARYYNPSLGRFISKDPLDYVDGLGLYEYCKSIPLLYMDYYGTKGGKTNCKVIVYWGHDVPVDGSGKQRTRNERKKPDYIPGFVKLGLLGCNTDGTFKNDADKEFAIKDFPSCKGGTIGVYTPNPHNRIPYNGGNNPEKIKNLRIKTAVGFAFLIAKAWEAALDQAYVLANREDCKCTCKDEKVKLVFAYSNEAARNYGNLKKRYEIAQKAGKDVIDINEKHTRKINNKELTYSKYPHPANSKARYIECKK